MQNQVKLDKIRDIVNGFEKELNIYEGSVKKQLEKMDRDEEGGKRRKETATKMIQDLEKRLFESERDRVLLRRETTDLTRDIKDMSTASERTTVNQQMLDMIKEN